MHVWRAVACLWKYSYNEVNGWKSIAVRVTIQLNGGPFLAAKLGPGGPVMAKFLPKSLRGTTFGETNFGVTYHLKT